MATTGLKYPTVAANNTSIGTVAWSNVNNALSDDSNNASVAPGAAISNYILLTGFDFSAIGDSDTIEAIQASVIRSSNTNGRVSDNSLRMFVAGVAAGNNKAAAGGWPAAEATVLYGDLTSDKWGLTLTGADVKAANFGIALAINGNASWQGFLDTIALNINYTPVAAGVEVAVNTAVIELAPQAISIDLGTPPGVEVPVSTAIIELAPQAISIDLGTPPGVEVPVSTAIIELAPQAISFDLGTPPGVEVPVSTAIIELVPQAISVDLGTPPAGVEVPVNTAIIELVPQPITIQAPGAAILIGHSIPLSISVDSTDYVDHNNATHSHPVVASSNPGANSVLLKSGDDGEVQLAFVGIGKSAVEPLDVLGNIQLTGELLHPSDLNIKPLGGDILLEDADIQAHNWISGTTGWGVSHAGDADFRNITADSLTVEAFIADLNLALAGSQLVTKSLGILSRAFTVPAATATLYVFDLPGFENAQVFDDGDYVRLRYIDRSGGGLIVGDAWGTVSSYTDLTGGEQSWTWTYISGSIGQLIGEGGIALDYGQSGDGYVHTTTLDAAGSPYLEIGTWLTDPSSSLNHTIHLRLGQLDGIAGIGDEWGLWAGQETNKFLLLSDVNFEAHGLRLSLYDSDGDETLRLDPNVPSLAIGEPLPTGQDSGGDGLWVGQIGGSYNFRLGKASGVSLRWNGSKLSLRNSDNEQTIVLDSTGESYFARPMTIGSNGGIWQGTGSFGTPTTGLKLWNDGGIGKFAGYNGGTEQFYMDTDGKFYGGGGDVVLDENGILIASGAHWPSTDITNKLRFGAIGELFASAGLDSVRFRIQTNSGEAFLQFTNELIVDEYLLIGGDLKRYHTPSGGSYDVAMMRYLTTPLTSTSWDGDSKTSANDGTIDLSAVFGVPAGVKAVLVQMQARNANTNRFVALGPNSTNPFGLVVKTWQANVYNHGNGVVPCNSNGDVYFSTNGADVVIEIWGYAI